jgi:exosome complex exonuclease RRP6
VQCHWVDTEEALQSLASKLESVSEFAVDLEHHSYRSYQGFTCLMQLSTRNEDFLIDTLELRHHMHLLLPAFTNPEIVKVCAAACRPKLNQARGHEVKCEDMMNHSF